MSHSPHSWRTTLVAFVPLLVLAIVGAWLNDFITLQGERTIYTVDCVGGAWEGDTCTGRLVAGDRYRFRALRVHSEVLFWRVGVKEASARLENCEIQDGRNWTCPAGADAARSITLVMDHGEAVASAAGATLPLHAVPKWRWLFLRWTAPFRS
jgi:hypothetical protein